MHESFPRIVVSGVSAALSHLFLSSDRLLEPSLNGDALLIQALVDYPDASRSLFAVDSDKKPEKAVVRRLLLLLLAVDLIRLRSISKPVLGVNGDEDSYESILIGYIPFSSDNIPAINVEAAWARLPTKSALVPKPATSN